MSKGYNLPAYNDKLVSQKTLQYWQNVLDLLAIAGRYAPKIEIFEGLKNPKERWKYEGAYQKLFQSSFFKLRSSVRNSEREFRNKICSINEEMRRRKMPIISEFREKEFLLLLQDQGRRDYYNREIKKMLPKNIVITLQELEEMYQNRKGQAK